MPFASQSYRHGGSTTRYVVKRVARYELAALMGVAGGLHLTSTETFERIIPPQLGNTRMLVLVSGIAELCVAALLTSNRTKRLGAFGCIALLIAVFPANIYAALQGGYESFGPPLNSPAAAWGRLPLQGLLIWWAWRVRE